MNKKGEEIGIGAIVTIFITAIVGVILLVAVAQENGKSLDTATLSNETITAAAAGVAYTFTDYKALSDVIITNATGGETVPSSNYTIANNQVVNGALASTLTMTADSAYAAQSLNVSATAQPLTYVGDSGARAVIGLIVVFFALGIAIVVLTPTLRSGVLNFFK